MSVSESSFVEICISKKEDAVKHPPSLPTGILSFVVDVNLKFDIEIHIEAESVKDGISVNVLGRDAVFLTELEIRGIGIGIAALLVLREDEHVIRLGDTSDGRDAEVSIEAGRRLILGEHGKLDDMFFVDRPKCLHRELCGVREIHVVFLATAEVILRAGRIFMEEGSEAVFNFPAFSTVEVAVPEAFTINTITLDFDGLPVDEECLEETETVFRVLRALRKDEIIFLHDSLFSHFYVLLETDKKRRA